MSVEKVEVRVPEVRGLRVERTSRRGDLPAPEGPMMASISPGAMLPDRPERRTFSVGSVEEEAVVKRENRERLMGTEYLMFDQTRPPLCGVDSMSSVISSMECFSRYLTV